MLYYYKLGYQDWEEAPYITLGHIKKFTKSEFDEMVLQSYVIADAKMKLSHNKWFDDWLEEKIKQDKKIDTDYIDDMRYKPSVSELYSEVVNIMKSEYNFFELKIEQSFLPGNCFDLMDEKQVDKGDDYLVSIHHRLKVVEKRDKKLNKVLNKKPNLN